MHYKSGSIAVADTVVGESLDQAGGQGKAGPGAQERSVPGRGPVGLVLAIGVWLMLSLIVTMAAYTLFLTWPLTQDGSKLVHGKSCADINGTLGFWDQAVYGLVVEPCRSAAEGASGTSQEAGAGGGGDGAGATGTTGTGNAAADSGSDGSGSEGGRETGPSAFQDNPPPVGQAGTVGEKDTKSSQAVRGTGAEAFSPSRTPNALFLAVLCAGMIGGAVHSLRAHTMHFARGTHRSEWTLWNLSRPFLGGAIAILLFFLIRAGFIEDGNAQALKPEGFIAIGGLVGLFTDQAWTRMRLVAESLFAKPDTTARGSET